MEQMNNLSRCRSLYEMYGAAMIHEKFPEYEDRIAVGFAGEGSDCFGYDDYISTDHDYSIGFVMWLTGKDYAVIGDKLQEAYRSLIRSVTGEEDSINLFVDDRRGAMRIGDFYSNILGYDIVKDGIGSRMWLTVTEDKLATATNGVIFRDDMGNFTRIREALLDYYPENIWRIKLAEQLYHFSQNVQSNYARMMARCDYVAANICVSQGLKSAMSMIYLLNRQYAPYYKWMRRGMEDLTILKESKELLDEIAVLGCQKQAWEGRRYNPYEINHDDAVVVIFEKLAVCILQELNRQEIVKGDNPFLDIYSKEIFADLARNMK